MLSWKLYQTFPGVIMNYKIVFCLFLYIYCFFIPNTYSSALKTVQSTCQLIFNPVVFGYFLWFLKIFMDFLPTLCKKKTRKKFYSNTTLNYKIFNFTFAEKGRILWEKSNCNSFDSVIHVIIPEWLVNKYCILRYNQRISIKSNLSSSVLRSQLFRTWTIYRRSCSYFKLLLN